MVISIPLDYVPRGLGPQALMEPNKGNCKETARNLGHVDTWHRQGQQEGPSQTKGPSYESPNAG